MIFPGNRNFAFTIFDDTDVSTVENVKPVYDLLTELGIRTTKTVWMSRTQHPDSNFSRSETMQDQHYERFVLNLHKLGFEIAFHGASMESSRRPMTIKALDQFEDVFGLPPKLHANHAENRDNLYWGSERFSLWPLRVLARLVEKSRVGKGEYFSGHVPDSEYFWGDLCLDKVKYVRNFCTDSVNSLSVNPSMPYHDPHRPFVNRWFSAVDAPNVTSFNRIITKAAIDKLEAERGVCIIATHFGKYFVRDGKVDTVTKDILEYVAQKGGWCVPAGEVLDYLATQQSEQNIGIVERTQLELRWLAYRLRIRGRDHRPDWAAGQ